MKRLLLISFITLSINAIAQTNTFPSSGNVGIGTTNPLYKLSINGILGPGNNTRGDGGYGGIDFTDNGIGYYQSAKIFTFRSSSSGEYYGLTNDYDGVAAQLSLIAKGSSGNICFYTGDPATLKMKITSSGNVGIGTSSPMYSFQIQKTNASPALMIGGGYSQSPRIQTYGLDADPNAWMGLGTDMGGNSYEHSIYFPYANGTGRLSIGSYNGSNYSTKITVLENGNAGIGTTNPEGKLDLVENNQHLTFLLNKKLAGTWPATNDATTMTIQSSGISAGNLAFATGNSEVMRITASSNVGIGTQNPAYKLDVLGTIRAKEVLVNLDGGADFVFEKDYKLLPIEHVATYVKENKHLPDIPSANEMVKNGMSMGDMQVKLLQKVEELTLYAIQQNTKLQDQGQKLLDQEKKNKELELELKALKEVVTRNSIGCK